MKIAGVDPGLTTGFCIIEFISKPAFYTIISANEIRGTVHDVVWQIARCEADFWAIEQWMLISKYAVEVSHNDPYSKTPRIIGGLESLLAPEKFVIQLPSTKKYTPDERLHELGLWHESRHVRDALRHAVFFTRRFTRETHGNKKIEGLSDFYSP